MKRIFLLLLAILPLLSIAQVKFSTDTFEEAQKQAQKEGKCLLVDVCRTKPDKSFNDEQERVKQLFADKALEKYITSNFLLLRIDMSDSKNASFGEKLNSLMYPCVCFYSSKGVQLEATSWGSALKDAAKFKEIAQKSLADAKVKAANSRKIEFRDISFEEAVALAKKENKLVFLDAYTPWCRPCKQMELHVFSLDNVADYFNQNFICVKYDLYKSRPDIAKRYAVKGYPTYLFINGDTIAANHPSGYMEASKLIEEGDKALKNANGITFTEGVWAEITAKAKLENKMIFVDCYTVWCGPCKQLSRTVFKDPSVADLMNDSFINVKIDMEKGEGIALKNKFEVKAFPTLLFISPTGEVEHRIVGSVPSKTFIKEANTALSGKGLNSFLKKYNEGCRDTAFLKEYIKRTNESYLKVEAEKASADLFEVEGVKYMLTPEGWLIFKENINNPYSALFFYFWDNRPLFVEKVGQKEVNQKTNIVWNSHARSFAKRSGEKYVFDEAGFTKYIEYMKAKGVNNVDEVKYLALVDIYGNLDNWSGFADLIDNRIKTKNDIGLMMLYNYPMRLEQKCADPIVRKRALAWVELGIQQATGNESAKMWLDGLLKLKESLLKPHSSKK